MNSAWAIIFITHDLGVVAQTADKVAVMYLGKLIEEGPVREVIGNPKHPYTRACWRRCRALMIWMRR